ncbi:Asp-tRNAAsn/Glu-tRNAGln amidotransferase A subunit [Arsukibacterium tuosuense]|uniref:Asp-tRNAAsn/Glu-tRNAGln amidotransferase A subunit n=1 Tax=Arsukibacterium tuosuense TaxID=1323745 RepID=A0A285J8H1_9GAMM|nr:amidase [Arsukibacterium tuosuense]SNY56625.1 Asp-tRNAAsn/Glu-tRNAGln amidotransferase A subunit [Arsukibacterium tuosuense]
MSPIYLPLTEQLRQFASGQLSPLTLMQQSLQRVERHNPALNAFNFLFADTALAQAEQAGQAYQQGTAGKLCGLPLAIKDETYIKGQITTNGSRCLADFVAKDTDPPAQRLLDAGAIILGRTTTPEFSTSAVTWSDLWGVSRNPWNPAITCGGSSGGSAIAVASGMASFANATDIGGSVRIPAAFCGLYGYKPPHGRVAEISPYNIDLYCHHSILTRSLDDLRYVYPLLRGADWRDSHSFVPDTNPGLQPRKPVRQLKIAVSANLGFYPLAPDIRRELTRSADALRAQGLQVDEVELNWDRRVIDTAKIQQRALMGLLLKRQFGSAAQRAKMTPYMQHYLAQVDTLTPELMLDANLYLCQMWDALATVFKQYDLLLCPTLATTDIRPDFDYSQHQVSVDGKAVDANKGWFMTYPFNSLSQCPVLSMPNGFCDNGVPSSLQIVGQPYQEGDVFAVAQLLADTVASGFYRSDFPQLA